MKGTAANQLSTPSNLEFQVDDIEDEWLYNPESFDYIHIRYMGSAIRDWRKLLGRCYEYLFTMTLRQWIY